MCLARVVFMRDQGEQKTEAMSDVARIERTPGKLRVTDLFGNTAELEADIWSIDFMESVVSVEKPRRPPEGSNREGSLQLG
jgi:predicted RNA-binding protein